MFSIIAFVARVVDTTVMPTFDNRSGSRAFRASIIPRVKFHLVVGALAFDRTWERSKS